MAAAKKTAAAKKAAAPKTETKPTESTAPEPTSEVKGQKVGSTWSIKASGRVLITRPDGSTCVAESNGKTASHVVNQSGTYRAEAGDQVSTVEVS